MRETLGLVGIYLGIVFMLQTGNAVVSHMVGLVAPEASLFVFLVLFAAVFAFCWPVAVRISHALMPETDEERAAVQANSLAHILKDYQPRAF